MITDDDRRKLTDMVMRALDGIEEYGDDAEFLGATMVFEVRVPDPDDAAEPWTYHGNYRSTDGTSTAHAGGMAQQLAHWLLTPDQGPGG